MAGCWEGELAGGDLLFEEVWLEPRGGVMLGVSRILQEDTVVEYEFLRIAEEDEALGFLVSPENQPPRLYKASEVGVGTVTFVSSELILRRHCHGAGRLFPPNGTCVRRTPGDLEPPGPYRPSAPLEGDDRRDTTPSHAAIAWSTIACIDSSEAPSRAWIERPSRTVL